MKIRKIQSKEINEKKKNRNKWIVGIVLIGIMLFGTIGYSFMSNDNTINQEDKIDYNGYEFIKNNNLWYLQINENVFAFKYNPNQVEKIPGYIKILNGYYNQPLYIFSENVEAELEIYRNMNNYVLRVQKACLEGEKCPDDILPVKTCEDNIIIIREDEISSIRQENNCVFIEGKKEELGKISDEFLFKILGIN